ncbi:NAD(P)-dependent alcohol dehydrogenase [Algiphilus sp.]|uniref:NAD(P)-dependent alcohol dehydrogenase n=1 Tax=Algiphilus sp. TaxID=1872431 RepID=UPI003B52E45E
MVECPAPKAGARDLVVRVHASSLNPHDWKYLGWFASSAYRLGLPLPHLRLGHDFVGTVIETGSRVRHFHRGDVVFGMSAKTGAFAEYVAVDERMVALKPKNVDDAVAAALPMVGLTALQALRMAHLRAGMSVLIIGGSGGVGSVAIQIAHHQGPRVTAVCSGRNTAFVRALSADSVVDYEQEDWRASGTVYDIIFDTIGQETVARMRPALKPGGCLISTATSAANALTTLTSRAVARFRPSAVRAGTLLALPRGLDMAELRDMVEAGFLKAPIDRRYRLEQLAEAIEYSKTGRARGKIVLLVAKD